MIKYLIDTCIWRDFYENRLSYSGISFGEDSSKLFEKIIKTKSCILFSEALYWELKKDYIIDDINNMLNILFLAKVLIKIDISKAEFIEAKALSSKRNLPFVDCLNAIQARNHKAIMITRDKHFSFNLGDFVDCFKPEELF